MPVKFIMLGVAATVAAVGMIIYENREQFYEYTERPRQHFANFLHKVAEGVAPKKHRQEEAPLSGRRQSSSATVENEKKSSAEDKETGDTATSTAQDHSKSDNLRLRCRGDRTSEGIAKNEVEEEGVSLLTDSAVESEPEKLADTITNTATLSSGRSSSSSSVATYTSPAVEVFHPPPPPLSNDSSGATPHHNSFEPSQPYWSIHEWAESASTHSQHNPRRRLSDDLGHFSDIGSEIGSEIMGSDPGSVNSWTDVASDMSA